MTVLGPASGVAFVRPPHGVLRSDPSVLAERIARALHPDHVAAMAAPLPTSTDLTKQPATDQGQTSSCSWHALAKGVEIISGFRGSMHVGYSATGSREGSLADTGRTLVDCLWCARVVGVAPFEGPTADGRNSDVDAANVTAPANLTELTLASHHRFDFATSLDPRDPNLSDLVVGALAIGAPIYLGTQIGQAFEDLGNGIVAQPDPANDPTGGGHALLIVGHRTNADGSRDFLVENSWGEGWSGNGECWASLAWAANTWELHPLVPASPAPTATLQRFEDELRAIV